MFKPKVKSESKKMGRPRIPEKDRKILTKVYIRPETYIKLKSMSAVYDKSMVDILQELVDEA